MIEMNVRNAVAWLPVTDETLREWEEDFCWIYELDPLVHSKKYVDAKSGRIFHDVVAKALRDMGE